MTPVRKYRISVDSREETSDIQTFPANVLSSRNTYSPRPNVINSRSLVNLSFSIDSYQTLTVDFKKIVPQARKIGSFS